MGGTDEDPSRILRHLLGRVCRVVPQWWRGRLVSARQRVLPAKRSGGRSEAEAARDASKENSCRGPKMRLLSLFDGTGSLSKPFQEAGWEVQSLDIDGRHGATLVCDILTWDFSDEPYPDVLWAACPCESYSCANTRGKRNLALADSLVAKTWEIITHFLRANPSMLWFVENPDSSMLWRRTVGKCLTPMLRLDFCQYGALYRKRTRLATNSGFVPRALCDPKTCHACREIGRASCRERV